MGVDRSFLMESLMWRYATHVFDQQKKIPQEDWDLLEDVLRFTPSTFGLQPWKFIIVQNRDLRMKLLPFTWNQHQVIDCSHYVVFATMNRISEEYILKYMKKVSDVRRAPLDLMVDYKKKIMDGIEGPVNTSNIIHFTRRQAYIAMGSLLTTAALMRIDTCPLEGLDREKYDELLGLKGTEYQTIAAVACGYRSSDDKYAKLQKVRFEKKEIITHID